MQAQVEIPFEDLLKIVKKLPEKQLTLLKKEIEKVVPANETKRQELRELLINGPTFSEKQIETIANTRKAINKWRTK